jgi:nicotinamide-nucleotide amidase
MKASIITIGDELLIGQVIDTNSAWIADKLNEIGIDIFEKVSISDDYRDIHYTVDRLLDKVDIILITGGLGPTKDDITKKALADYFETEMIFHEPTWFRIQGLFKRWGRSTTKAHKEQSFMPESAELLKNNMGTAPGMLFRKNDKLVISMPGVPYEMQFIMADSVIPLLIERNKSSAIVHYTIKTAGEGESRLAQRIDDIAESLPSHIKLAYLPGLGQVRLRLTGRGADKALITKEIQEFGLQIESRIAEFIYGYNLDSLEELVGKLCVQKGLRLGTAESCTGGYIASKLTSVPGSSAYFMGSIVAYSNEVKKSILGVNEETLTKYGAVSEETVREMLSGLFRVLPVDLGIAVSGIAGPDGGTPDKPVGTIWIAYGSKDKISTYLLQTSKNRGKNIEYSTSYALNLIRKFLIGME